MNAVEHIVADDMTMRRKAFGIQADSEGLADKRQIRVNVSSERPDRAGDIVVQKGIDFGAFMSIGGTVLWQHDPNQPVAKAVEMNVKDDQLQALVQFPSAGISAKADEIYGLIRTGVVNAASIGFSPKAAPEPLDPKEPFGGYKFQSVELMEFSFVSVPCAREATIVARSLERSRMASKAANWKVGASRNLPIDRNSAWDGAAAQESIFDAYGFNGDSPDTAKARKGFLLYDASAPNLKGSYKEPFARVVNGRLTAVAAGVRNAASRLPQTTGVPDDVLKSARAVIDHYEAQFGDDGKSFTPEQLAGVLSKMSAEDVATFFVKAGRVLSQDSMAHVEQIGKCLKGMQECAKSATGVHEVMLGMTQKAAKLHDDLHDTMLDMMDHGTSLGDHVKALMKSNDENDDDDTSDDGNDDGADDSGSDDDDASVADPSNSDEELSADAAERKRQIEVMERSSAH